MPLLWLALLSAAIAAACEENLCAEEVEFMFSGIDRTGDETWKESCRDVERQQVW